MLLGVDNFKLPMGTFYSKHWVLHHVNYSLVRFSNTLDFQTSLQSNLDYPDLDYPDYSIIRTFFSGPNFFMNIN